MGDRHKEKQKKRERRKKRRRKKIFGTPDRPRLSVYRSNNHIYSQVIDDVRQETLVSASTNEPSLRDEIDHGGNKESARKVGELLAERASEEGIEKVVFDVGPYKYHGRVKALAEAAREGGLEF